VIRARHVSQAGRAGIRSIVNPDKLQHLGPVGDFGSLVSEPATG
jgi:hypothetical protein